MQAAIIIILFGIAIIAIKVWHMNNFLNDDIDLKQAYFIPRVREMLKRMYKEDKNVNR